MISPLRTNSAEASPAAPAVHMCATFDVLHVVPYMHPRAGGPPVVVDRLCRRLTDRGWTSRVISTDTFSDPGDRSWLEAYEGHYPLEVYPSRGPGSYSYSRSLAAQLDRLVPQCRLVHLHTVWTYPTWAAMKACRRHGVPYVVMPHGMLDPYSLERKWLKKQLYGRLIEWPNLRRAKAMIYTHDAERQLAESSIAGLPSGYIVPLGSDEPPQAGRNVLAEEFLCEHPHLRGRAVVTFLSRLHPKKGLDLLIPAFADLVTRRPSAHLVLVGPGEESYVQRLRQMVEQFSIAESVTFIGPLEGRAKWAALAASNVFVLPSFQENFAIVVVEAQRMGVPVVLSRRVNIWEDIVSGGGGVACDLNLQSISDGDRVGARRSVSRKRDWREGSAIRERAI